MSRRLTAAIAAVLVLVPLHAGCASKPTISAENEAAIREYWPLYLKARPEWEEAKAKWLAMGEPERKCLVNLLIRNVINQSVRPRMDAVGNPEPGWTRSVDELKSLGKTSLAPLLATLEGLKDETVVLPCVEALAGVAGAADIEEVFERSGSDPAFQVRLVRVLVRIEDPEATRLVLQILNGPYDWKVRASAAADLKTYKGPMLTEVIHALEQALDDEDPFISKKAADSLDTLCQGRR